MEEEKGGATSSARPSSSFPPPGTPPVASSSAHVPKEAVAGPLTTQRQRFSVELRPGETTIVSWRKLVREYNKGHGEPPAPSGANPALASRIATPAAVQPVETGTEEAQPPPNRFSAVIEKIERLYMGKESSDEEELGDVPDDDQYDTEDSFIDDTELNEYFEVEKSATKHNGFFVNRGMLERVEPSLSPDVAPKKRRRKDSTTIPSEKHVGHAVNDLVNLGNVRMKAAARSGPLVGKRSSSPSRILSPFVEHNQEGKILKNVPITSAGICRKKSADPTTRLDSLPSVKKQNKDISASCLDEKDVESQKVGSSQSRESAKKLRTSDESFGAFNLPSLEKSVSFQAEPQPKLNKENEVELPNKSQRQKNGISDLPDLNTPSNIYPSQGARSSRVKEGSGVVRPKGTTLERAIRDLERIVAESRPPHVDIQESDASSLAIKKRLPQEVKQKLAKVARLAASQGKVKEEDLIDRLMGIVGHLVQRKTLKRNLREMVELGISAKQIKADRFQQIKKEVVEMIKTRVVHSKIKVPEQHGGSSDDFQEVSNGGKIALEAKYSMDDALEDKICDLYDLYVEGMDEDKGPQMRKLYAELAELWPNGSMDNVGIKHAVYRAKERKRALYRQQKHLNGERIKRKKMQVAVRMEDNITLGLQARALQDRPDSTGQVLSSSDKAITNQFLPPSGRMTEQIPSCKASSHHGKNLSRVTGDGIMVPDEGIKFDAATLKKKLKRKSEFVSGEIHVHPGKHTSCLGKEKQKVQKHSANSIVRDPHELTPQSSLPGSQQPS
uniref:Ubinuclein-1 n=1 Tax=Anthurium amnicola TaxID=1678845 RepID=A0A1D1XVD4_9ARAE